MHKPGDTMGLATKGPAEELMLMEVEAPSRAPLFEVPNLTRVLLDSMTEGVSLASEDGTIVYTNSAEDRMFGYEPGELVGQSVAIQNAYAPEENVRVVADVIAELKRGGSWRGEWLNRRKDGTEFFTTSRISAVEIDGRPHWLCVQEDVTEQRNAASALRDSQARLELATQAAELGVWDWDIATDRMTYSPLAKAIFGFAPDRDVTLADVRAATHPEDLPRTWAMAERALDSALQEREPYQYRIVRPDGEVRWVLAHGEAVFAQAADGPRATRYVGTLQDITERRRLEEADRGGKARLTLAVEAGRMAVWEIDLVTDQITGSPELNRLLGFPEESTPTADEMRARYYPGERERLQSVGQEVLARGDRSLEVEYRYVWPDGSIRWHLLRAEVHVDAAGRPIKALGVVMDVSDRREAETRLRDSEERYRQIVEGADDFAIIALDESGTITSWNVGAERMLGYAGDEAIGQLGGIFFPPEDRAAGAPDHEMNRAKVDGKAVNERWHLRKDGTRFWGSGLMMRLDTPGGGYLKIFRDRTAEHEAEASMRQSEERLRATVLGSPFPIMLHAEDGEVLELSRKWTELTGYSRDNIRNHSDWFRLAYPDDFERVEELMAREFANEGETAAREMAVRAKDGSSRIWDFYNVGLGRLPDGRRLQISAAMDVTARRQDENALRELAATLEQRVEERTSERNRIWAMSRDLFAIMGMDGYLKAVNPAWETTLGYAEATLLTMPFPQQVHPDDHVAVAAVVERLQRGETIARFEDRLRHADGTWRWIAWTLVPEGDVFYAVGRDVTAEKEAAAELEQAQASLRQAQKMEAVGQLTGGIAHDFNNLLAAVLGGFDLILRKPEDTERVRRIAERGLEAAQRGAKLTGQLLAFSRAQRIELKPLVVTDVVEGMAEMLSNTLGPMVRMTLTLDPTRVPVMSDTTQLEMAVLNLAINARDAMPEGGSLTISTSPHVVARDAELAPGVYVEFAITDTGSGMAPEVAARAFDPFFTTKGVGKGTGLGLSQVYGIAKQAGGTVRIESEPGTGTTVRMFLKTTDRAVEGAVDIGQVEPISAGPTATVLVIDDDVHVRGFLVDSLDALGYSVIAAEDGPSGLAELERSRPDVMVVDFAMPGMNGAEVAKAALTRVTNMPIIFASGYADTGAIEDVMGPDAMMLRKPFGVNELQSMVAEALRRRS